MLFCQLKEPGGRLTAVSFIQGIDVLDIATLFDGEAIIFFIPNCRACRITARLIAQ